jgi:hypothetical protein
MHLPNPTPCSQERVKLEEALLKIEQLNKAHTGMHKSQTRRAIFTLKAND